MDRLEAASRYLEDDRPECKVVGIMIINSLLGAGGTGLEPSTVIGRALELTGVPFVLRMIATVENRGSKDPSASLAGLEFALMACSCGDIAGKFFKHLPEVLALVEQLANRPAIEQYIALIVLIATTSRKKWRAVIDALLEKLAVDPVSSGCYLQVFAAVVAGRCDGDENQLEVTPEKADILRSVVIRGLHGAALQAQRDATLLALSNLLSSRAQPHTELLALSPSWTIISSSSEDQRASDGSEGPKQEASGAFAQVLCAVVRGELQLLCDEALFLASSTPDAVAERFSLEVPARPRPAEASAAAAPSGDSGPAADTDSALPAGEPAAATAPPSRLTNPANDVAYFQGRASRTVAVFCTCLRLLEIFLELLIGSQGGQLSEQGLGQGQEPAWVALPVEALMQIKRSLYGAVDDLFTFVKDCSELLSGGDLHWEGRFLTAAALRSLVDCAADSLGAFVVQDAQLAAAYIDHLPALMKTSHLRLNIDGSVELGGAIGKEELVQLVRALGEGVEDLKARLSERAGYKPSLAVSAEQGKQGGDDTSSEVMLHTVRVLQELADAALAAKGAEEGLSVDSTALERLCDYMPQLLPRLQYLVHISVIHLQAQGSSATSDEDLLKGAADLCRVFVSLVGVYESRHSGELTILRAQEGDEAVLTALGLDLRRHGDTAGALNALCPQLECAREGDSGALDHCLEAFRDFACAFEPTRP